MYKDIPGYIVFAFLLAFILTVRHIGQAIKEGAIKADFSSVNADRMVYRVYLFFIGWVAYVYTLTFTGIIAVNELPPRALLFFTLPLLLFYFLWLNKQPTFIKVIKAMPLKTLIRVHLFRFIAVFFLILWQQNYLPKEWAWPAAIGDILTALLSIPVSYYVLDKGRPVFLLYLWNFFGLIDIVMVVVLAVVITKQSMAPGSGLQNLLTLSRFPFVLVPAFAPATIMFLHYQIFKRLRSDQ